MHQPQETHGREAYGPAADCGGWSAVISLGLHCDHIA